MAELLISEIEPAVIDQLRESAGRRGKTIEQEAKRILTEALYPRPSAAWSQANAIQQALAASGRAFSDSTELLREDRGR